jgi:hypothetical protein
MKPNRTSGRDDGNDTRGRDVVARRAATRAERSAQARPRPEQFQWKNDSRVEK